MRRGSKYDPLRDFLTTRRQPELSMSFDEIEDILGFGLPDSASTPQWWANVKGTTQHTQVRAWRDAGYDAFLASSRDGVLFLRVDVRREVGDVVAPLAAAPARRR